MKTPRFIVFSAGAVLGLASAYAAASKSASDLASPQKRQEVVDKAIRLTRPPEPAPIPSDLAQPFNPANFDQADPEEIKANQAAGTGPVQPVGPVGDRELLEAIAARIQPTGSTIFRGQALLNFGTKRVSQGQVISVAYNERDYDLEVVAIDRTNFTLRFRGEEITRPIKPTK